MLIPQECHKLPLDDALAQLLASRVPVMKVQRTTPSSSMHWQEQRGSGSGGNSGGQGQGQRGPGRRLRQFQALLGADRVTISADADESAPDFDGLLSSLQAAYAH